MTGFGQGAAETPALRVEVQIRSVNNRFADIRLRLPDSITARETDLRRRVQPSVRRGRVEVDVRLERNRGEVAGARVNRAAAAGVLEAARALREALGVPGAIDVSTLLQIPGVLETSVSNTLDDAEWAAVERALDLALAAFEADRAREGAALAQDLAERFARMRAQASGMVGLAGAVPAAIRKKLTDRIQTLLASAEIDPARLAQEAAFLADRADITEELVRLDGHLGQAASLLSAPDGEPVGKRLDFLLQEIQRETNTVCSKSPDLEITRGALDLKAETERVREQIQNLE